MKKRLILVCALCLSLVAGFLMLSCAPGPGNVANNQNANVAANQGNANTIAPTSLFSDACDDDLSLDDRRKAVEGEIKEQFEKHPRLLQYVQYAVKVDGNHIVILLGGGVKFKDDIDDLIRIVRRFLKSKCALRVYFVNDITKAAESTGLRYDGFEWVGCEHPKVICPNGECKEEGSCGGMTNTNSGNVPTATPSANTNANANRHGND